MNYCQFTIAWTGVCGDPVDSGPVCDFHAKQECTVCGEQATMQCPLTRGMVCATPLCDSCDCPCTDHSDG